ncbi:hypothetical protein [Psychrobacter glacincola]|uniref:hypothetical protein n=1 Tax=Psychrobacter glacincola TaxID=56810 RepID=UPI0039AF386D
MKITNTIIAASLFLSLPMLAGASDSNTTGKDPNWATYQKRCMEFVSISKNLVSTLIEEMEQSRLPIEDYLTHSQCRPKKYSTSVQSPMLHYIIEDPSNRQDFLTVFWLYYSKKRKEPEIFNEIINVQNTLGETMLDYAVTLEERDLLSDVALNGPLDKIITMLCDHGGVYATRKDRKCP